MVRHSATAGPKTTQKHFTKHAHADHHAVEGQDIYDSYATQTTDPVPRVIFPWVPSKKLANEYKPGSHELITVGEMVKKHGAPRYVIADYVNGEKMESEAFFTLPYTVFMVLSFAFMVIGQLDAPSVRSVEDSLIFDIEDNANFAYDGPYTAHKHIYDVGGGRDFWAFVNTGLVPLLMYDQKSYSEDKLEQWRLNGGSAPYAVLPDKEQSLMSRYNRIVGGIRFRQERSKTIECEFTENVDASLGETCVPRDEYYQIAPELVDAMQTNAAAEKTRWIWTHDTTQTVYRKINEMEVDGWLDDQVSKVEISVPTYNAEFGLHTLLTVNFYFSTGGHTSTRIIAQSCFADWFYKWRNYVFDAAFCVSIAWMFIAEIWDVGQTACRFGLRKCCREYATFFNAIDWLSILTGAGIIAFGYFTLEATEKLNVAAENLADSSPPADAYQDWSQVDKYMDTLTSTTLQVFYLQRYLAIYPLVVSVRLFKGFHAQPRLALVTRSLKGAAVPLAHFMLIFFCIFVAFSASGQLIFGRDNENFMTIGRALTACLLLAYGDLEAGGFGDLNKAYTGPWTVVFVITCHLLMMNMTLAIIMDAYSEVKEKAGNTETLFTELKQTMYRGKAWWKGEFVPFGVVLKAVQQYKAGVEVDAHPVSSRVDGSGTENSVQAEASSATTASYKAEGTGLYAWRRQVLRCDDLVDLVKQKGGKDMTKKQAFEILEGAIQEFYEQNIHQLNTMSESRSFATDIYWRANVLMKPGPQHCVRIEDFEQRHDGKTDTLTDFDTSEAMLQVREEMEAFLGDANADRDKSGIEIRTLRAEIGAIKQKLHLMGQDAEGEECSTEADVHDLGPTPVLSPPFSQEMELFSEWREEGHSVGRVRAKLKNVINKEDEKVTRTSYTRRLAAERVPSRHPQAIRPEKYRHRENGYRDLLQEHGIEAAMIEDVDANSDILSDEELDICMARQLSEGGDISYAPKMDDPTWGRDDSRIYSEPDSSGFDRAISADVLDDSILDLDTTQAFRTKSRISEESMKSEMAEVHFTSFKDARRLAHLALKESKETKNKVAKM